MFAVDTVYVLPTGRDSYAVLDLLRSLRWGSRSSHYTVIVDRKKTVQLPADITDGCTVLTIDQDSEISDQFVAGLGLKWCVDNGVTAKQFVLLDDKCMVLQPGLDVWALEQLAKQQVGLLGVKDRLNYEDAYSKVAPLLAVWELPHALFTPGPETLHEAALFIASPLVQEMFKRNLLLPPNVEQWPLPYGPYISWLTQMYGLYQVAWGSMDLQMPPLYVNHTRHSRFQPAPHILNPQFKLYYSARNVMGYTEERLRESYKRMRGEQAKPFEPLRPTVSPQPIGPPSERRLPAG